MAQKMITAVKAQDLTLNSDYKMLKTDEEVSKEIRKYAKMGYCNAIMTVDFKKINKIADNLEKNGFEVWIEGSVLEVQW